MQLSDLQSGDYALVEIPERQWVRVSGPVGVRSRFARTCDESGNEDQTERGVLILANDTPVVERMKCRFRKVEAGEVKHP